jgi:hypothetical protein
MSDHLPAAPTPLEESHAPPESEPTPAPAVVKQPEAEPAPTPAPAPETPPADLVPAPGRRERFAWYAGTMLLSLVLVAAGLRLDAADLKAPFYYDLDSLLMLPLVKATVERGFGGHWANEMMGAPGTLELYDFPVIDHLHFLILWLLGQVVSNVLVLYNLYFLLTFPLTVLTAMIAMRHLGVTLPAAAVGGFLYSFMPYHYQRWENHYFLAAYWMVPLSLLPVFAITRGDLPFFRKRADGSYRRRVLSWRTLGLVVLSLAVASAGAYYAFFTCAVTAFAGLYAWVALRTWRAAAAAGGVVALVVGFGVVNHLPTYFYQARYGQHPVTDRYPEEADHYGLKVTHLVLPIEDHNLRAFNKLKWIYNSSTRPAETENRSASLGLVGAAGLVGLVAVLLLPVPRPWPVGPLAAVTAFCVLLATVGGFGSVFNLVVSPQIRGYNRISVFIGFFCYLAFVWAFDKLWAHHPRGLPARYLALFAAGSLAAVTLTVALLDVDAKLIVLAALGLVWLAPAAVLLFLHKRHPEYLRRGGERLRGQLLPTWFRYPAWGALALLGFLDQTPYSWFKSGIVQIIDEHAARFRGDAVFFGEIERRMLKGNDGRPPRVFCLPYCPFPETAAVHRMPAYEHARGYVHTSGLVWSFGAMKGREADVWQREVSHELNPKIAVDRLVFAGFDGLLIDRRGYAAASGNRASEIESAVKRAYEAFARRPFPESAEVVHPDHEQIFLDLRPYRDELRKKDPAFFEREALKEREYVAITWLKGFHRPVNEYGESPPFIHANTDGTAWVVNPTDRTRTFRVWMSVGVYNYGTFHFRLSGLLEDEFDVDRQSAEWDPRQFGVPREYVLVVPPGRHTIRFHCTPPPDYIPNDSRKLCYYLFNVRKVEQ